MRSFASLRSRMMCALVVIAAALFVAAPVAQAGDIKVTPKKYYLALGDSLAFGYQGYKVGACAGTGCASPNTQFTTGYVDAFTARLKTIKPDIETINNGCPGATSASMNNVAGCTTYPFPTHHQYGAGQSQLADAVAFLQANKEKVSPITVNIGNNDVLALVASCGGLVNIGCIGAGAGGVFGTVAANLSSALAQLRAAAPSAKIIVLGTYNPYAVVPAGAAANGLTQQFNAVLGSVAAGGTAEFADPFAAFNGATPQPQTLCLLTLMCPGVAFPTHPGGDIHASDAGYQVLGDKIWDASGYAAAS